MGKITNQVAEVHDILGYSILKSISGADKFNRWMYETIKPFCKGRILEIGGGIGNISQYFLNDGARLVRILWTLKNLHGLALFQRPVVCLPPRRGGRGR